MDPLGDGQVWGHAPTAALALAHGASPTHREPHMGSTPMLWAACRGNVDILRALIDAGGDVNQGDFHGMYTPLIAVARGKVLTGAVDRAWVLLAEPGLDPLATRGGKTAEEWARERGMDDVADAIAGEVRGALCAAQPCTVHKTKSKDGVCSFRRGAFVCASLLPLPTHSRCLL